MEGVLDESPDAVVFLLPGGIRTRPIEVRYLLGLIDMMAERDAPGGCHLASEYSYRMHDPVTQASVPRFDECRMGNFAKDSTLAYWARRCTVAPGVWALHMAESEASDYPVRPWAEEHAERLLQMRILRSLSKRYLWSFSSHGLWYVPGPGSEWEGGGRRPEFPDAEAAVSGWHNVLRDRVRYREMPDADPRMLRIFDAVREFDDQTRSPDSLCDAFGTPGTWWVLGPLSNPHIGTRTAAEALEQPIDAKRSFYGRDGMVRWFQWNSHDPRGLVNTRSVFDFIGADNMSMHLATWVHSDAEREAVLHLGWHDGLTVRLGGTVVLDRPDYEPVVHNGFHRDRYQFNERIPVKMPKGATLLVATIIQATEAWRFALRITDADGYPIPGIRFSMNSGE